MVFKKNKKAILISIILLFICILFCGCSGRYKGTEIDNSQIGENQFCMVSADGIDDYTDIFTVYDKDTKVMYMIVRYSGGYKGGISVTVMVDENGKPLIYSETD